MAKVDIWMPLYIGDYLADTMRLTTEQHGAYLLLLMEYWRCGPLPDDDEELSAITKLSTEQWLRNRHKIARFFVVGDGIWRHKRADAEMESASLRRKTAQENGKKGGAPRGNKNAKTTQKQPKNNPANNPKTTQQTTQKQPDTQPKNKPKTTSSPSPSPSPNHPSLPGENGTMGRELSKWGTA